MNMLQMFSWPFLGYTLGVLIPLLFVLFIGVLILKGFALWYSARGNQTGWFIALLIVNTFGILEIIYLIFFRPKPKATAPDATVTAAATDTTATPPKAE